MSITLIARGLAGKICIDIVRAARNFAQVCAAAPSLAPGAHRTTDPRSHI